MNFICGVDPGLSGAIAVLDPASDQIMTIIDMPQLKRGARSDLDLVKLASFIGTNAPNIKYAVIEDVGAMPGQGVVSMFTFGKVTGVVVGMLAAHYIPIFYVKPSVWKFQMGLTKSKDKSVVMARKLWPKQTELFSRMKDDGRAEAALMAHFGKRFWNVGA